jgi:hypothetical protein
LPANIAAIQLADRGGKTGVEIGNVEVGLVDHGVILQQLTAAAQKRKRFLKNGMGK